MKTNEIPVLTYCEFCELKDDNGRVVLVDLATVPLRIGSDFLTRNVNVRAGNTLCARCDGTGNQLYAMYQECTACKGTGNPEQQMDRPTQREREKARWNL